MLRKSSLLKITDEPTAAVILGMMRGELDPCEVSERTDQWERACYHRPSDAELILHAADELLETCGVEGWAHSDDFTRGVSYCNTGDMYALTLALVDGDFQVCSYEDLANV